MTTIYSSSDESDVPAAAANSGRVQNTRQSTTLLSSDSEDSADGSLQASRLFVPASSPRRSSKNSSTFWSDEESDDEGSKAPSRLPSKDASEHERSSAVIQVAPAVAGGVDSQLSDDDDEAVGGDSQGEHSPSLDRDRGAAKPSAVDHVESSRAGSSRSSLRSAQAGMAEDMSRNGTSSPSVRRQAMMSDDSDSDRSSSSVEVVAVSAAAADPASSVPSAPFAKNHGSIGSTAEDASELLALSDLQWDASSVRSKGSDEGSDDEHGPCALPLDVAAVNGRSDSCKPPSSNLTLGSDPLIAECAGQTEVDQDANDALQEPATSQHDGGRMPSLMINGQACEITGSARRHGIRHVATQDLAEYGEDDEEEYRYRWSDVEAPLDDVEMSLLQRHLDEFERQQIQLQERLRALQKEREKGTDAVGQCMRTVEELQTALASERERREMDARRREDELESEIRQQDEKWKSEMESLRAQLLELRAAAKEARDSSELKSMPSEVEVAAVREMASLYVKQLGSCFAKAFAHEVPPDAAVNGTHDSALNECSTESTEAHDKIMSVSPLCDNLAMPAGDGPHEMNRDSLDSVVIGQGAPNAHQQSSNSSYNSVNTVLVQDGLDSSSAPLDIVNTTFIMCSGEEEGMPQPSNFDLANVNLSFSHSAGDQPKWSGNDDSRNDGDSRSAFDESPMPVHADHPLNTSGIGDLLASLPQGPNYTSSNGIHPTCAVKPFEAATSPDSSFVALGASADVSRSPAERYQCGTIKDLAEVVVKDVTHWPSGEPTVASPKKNMPESMASSPEVGGTACPDDRVANLHCAEQTGSDLSAGTLLPRPMPVNAVVSSTCWAQPREVKCRSCGNTGRDLMGEVCSCPCGRALASSCHNLENMSRELKGQPCVCPPGQQATNLGLATPPRSPRLRLVSHHQSNEMSRSLTPAVHRQVNSPTALWLSNKPGPADRAVPLRIATPPLPNSVGLAESGRAQAAMDCKLAPQFGVAHAVSTGSTMHCFVTGPNVPLHCKAGAAGR